MSKKEYFAYGSNLNFEQMVYRCPEATVVGTAKLDGYELAFRRGYLTILPKEGATVEGLIWSITDHDEAQLDCYEGYSDCAALGGGFFFKRGKGRGGVCVVHDVYPQGLPFHCLEKAGQGC